MEREIMPDYAAETFYQYLIPPDVFEGSEESQEEVNHRVVSCKRVTPNLFDRSKGVAVVKGVKNIFNDEVCMIVPSCQRAELHPVIKHK